LLPKTPKPRLELIINMVEANKAPPPRPRMFNPMAAQA